MTKTKDPYYITTPIYYVNAKPHIGTAYTTVAADTLARFMRLDGKDVKFLTGTDEHGQKVEQSALAKGVTPQAYVDEISQEFHKLSDIFGFTNDAFIRTTQEHHKKSAQALWMKLVEKGQIYKSAYKGWYSVRDEAFYNEDEIVDGKAPTGTEVTWVEEPGYFFRLSEWQDKLLELYKNNPDFIAPKSRLNEVKSFVQGGLKDLCVSRSSCFTLSLICSLASLLAFTLRPSVFSLMFAGSSWIRRAISCSNRSLTERGNLHRSSSFSFSD